MNQDPNNNFFNQNNGMPTPDNGMQPNMNDMNQMGMPNGSYPSNGMPPNMNDMNQMGMSNGSYPSNGMPMQDNGMQQNMNNYNQMNNMGGMNNFNQMDNMNNVNNMNGMNNFNQVNDMNQMGMSNGSYPSNGIPMNMNNNNNMFFQNTSSSDYGAPKKDNKKIIIAIIVLLLVLVVGGVLIFGKKDSSKTYEKVMEDIEKDAAAVTKKIMKNVTYEKVSDYTKSNNRYYVFSLSSTNNKFVNVTIPIKFYDSNNVQVKDDTLIFTCVEAGAKLYTVTYDDGKAGTTYKIEEDKIEARYSENVTKCVSYKNDLSYKIATAENSKIEITATNNTSSALTVYGYLFFKKGGTIVDSTIVSYTSIDSKGSAKSSAYVPYDENFNDLQYDEMEFVSSMVKVP